MMARVFLRAVPCVVAVGTIFGCTIGGLNNFEPAHSPGGITIRLEGDGVRDFVVGSGHFPSPLVGELLAVRDDGVVIHLARRIVLVPYRIIQTVGFLRKRSRWRGQGPDAIEREEVRLVSRFPQGLSDELLEALLASSNQPQLIVASGDS